MNRIQIWWRRWVEKRRARRGVRLQPIPVETETRRRLLLILASAIGAFPVAVRAEDSPPSRRGSRPPLPLPGQTVPGGTGGAADASSPADKVSLLVASLRVGSELERARAAIELRDYAELAVPSLLNELPVAEPRTAVWMLTVLSESESDAAVSAIRGCLSHDDARVRSAASLALDRAGESVGADALHVLKKGNLGERRALMGHLSNEENPQSLEVLTRALRDVDWMIRSRARRTLISRLQASRDDSSFEETLVNLLLDVHSGSLPGAKTDVIGLLAFFDEPRVHAVLVRDLEDPQSEHRLAAVRSLGRMTDSTLVEPVLDLGREEECVRVRGEIVKTLAAVGGVAVAPTLIKGLRDPSRLVRREAHQALVRLFDVDFGERFWAWTEWWKENRHRWPDPEIVAFEAERAEDRRESGTAD